MKDINLYTTKELLEELFSRFDHCIFAAKQHRDKNNSIIEQKFKGSSDDCISLSVKIQHFVYEDWRMNKEKLSENFKD